MTSKTWQQIEDDNAAFYEMLDAELKFRKAKKKSQAKKPAKKKATRK